MQVIEYSKKGVLGFLRTVEELYIIYYKYIHQLIEMYEIIDRIVTTMIHKLIDEFLRADIKHHLILMETLYLVPDGLRQMRLAQPYPSIYNQRIERIGARLFRYRLTSTASHPVAIPLDERIKCIHRIDLC